MCIKFVLGKNKNIISSECGEQPFIMDGMFGCVETSNRAEHFRKFAKVMISCAGKKTF